MLTKKVTTVLSLAVLLTFGVSACGNGGSPGVSASEQNQAAPSQDSSKQSPKESVRLEAISTLNKVHELKSSDEFLDFHDKISAADYTATGDFSAAKDIFNENASLVNEYESLAGYSDANKDFIVNMMKAYSGKETLPDEDTLKRILEVSAFTEESTNTEKVEGKLSYNIISEAVQEKDGKFFVTGDNVYTQDANNAVINFPFSEKETLHLENGGKRIVMDTASEQPPTKPTGWYILQSDVKNAATSIEYWIVDQKGNTTELVVENDSIVSGFQGKNQDRYTFKLDEGTTIKVSGNSYEYTITGTYEGLEEEVIYDSAGGGLQASKVKPTETAEPKPEPGIDYTLWSAYAEKVYASDSGKLVGPPHNSIEAAVGMLNKDIAEDEAYEVTERNGKKYIQVKSSKSEIGSKGDLLWVYDRTTE